MTKHRPILIKGQIIDDKFSVVFFVKKGRYAETYRVSNKQGETKLLKLFIYSELDRSQFGEDGEPIEIEILKKLDHPNLVKYSDDGTLIIDRNKYAYVIVDFISGETAADKLQREGLLNKYDVKDLIEGALNGLDYLHHLQDPVIHNDISSLNLMLDLSGKSITPKIIDFGYARYLKQYNRDYLKEGLNPFYQADETFNKVFSAQSDLFSIGVLYYHLLEGLPPWYVEVSQYKSDHLQLEDLVLAERRKPLKFSDSTDPHTQDIIIKALQSNPRNRFKNAQEFIQAINGELELEMVGAVTASTETVQSSTKQGEGFAAIAGMQELKNMLQLDVIDALNDKERYIEYGLTIPNGMLLYGPPGCGKTFFAERLSEQIGFTFYQIKPSDIQSKWVNASQENIKNLFDEARKKAPSIVFIDELDALVPNRNDSNISHMNTSAVNEFLVQINNCGDDGVFVIGATNRPAAIDPAILRKGRLDKKIYLPPPDYDARRSMFELYLKNRPIEIGLDYDRLAELTENYVSSDIRFLSDEAARTALKYNTRISNDILHATIKENQSSIPYHELMSYSEIKKDIESGADAYNKTKMGFNIN